MNIEFSIILLVDGVKRGTDSGNSDVSLRQPGNNPAFTERRGTDFENFPLP